MSRRIEFVPLAEIKRARRNPKQHDDTAIAASLNRFGLGELPLIDERTGLLVAGEGRVNQLAALKEADPRNPPDGIDVSEHGEWLVPVIAGWASADDKEADAYLIASNRLSERGGWDGAGLAEMLSALEGEFDGLGYSQQEFDTLLRETGYLAEQATKFLDDLPTASDVLSPGFTGEPNENPYTGSPMTPPLNPFQPNGQSESQPASQTVAAAHPDAPAHSATLPTHTPSAAGATEPQWFQLTWTATHQQRETIHDAIRRARETGDTDTAIAALAAICQYYLDYAGEQA